VINVLVRIEIFVLSRLVTRKDPIAGERAALLFSKVMGRLILKHRVQARRNIDMVFADRPDDWREALFGRCFDHFGRTFTDFMRIKLRSREELMSSMKATGFEILEEALKEGKGVLAVSGHLGHFVRIVEYLAALGYEVCLVNRTQNDRTVNNEIVARFEGAGVRVIPRGNAAASILRALHAKKIVVILPDQNYDEPFLPFLGFPAGTAMGPGVIHQRTGAPIVMIYCVRTGPNAYEITAERLKSPSIFRNDPAEATMVQINDSLSAMIRKFPEQYLWLHDRWRSARRLGLIGANPQTRSADGDSVDCPQI
jgi:KDO2-lipid IV(A) lauroyltransferase